MFNPKLSTLWAAWRFVSAVAHKGQSGLFCRSKHGFLPELELRFLQCTCCWRSRVPVAGFETLNTHFLTPSGPCKADPDEHLDTCYTAEQRDTILRLLNHASPSELACVKLLKGKKSVNIVEYRTKNGPFKTLESVVNVPLLKHKTAHVVFESILNPVRKEKKATKTKLVKFIKPEIDRSWLEDANSIVSIVCGTNKVAWSRVDREMTVLDWEQLQCPNFLSGTYMASAYLNDVSEVVSRLPPADFYIIEKHSFSSHSATLFPIITHMKVVEAMLFALLKPRNTPSDSGSPPRVLNINRAAVGRHFGLLVGESRTSGADLIQQLMFQSVSKKPSRVNFPPELLIKYRSRFRSSRRGGEELCDALLQAVAFYELLSESSS